MALSEDNLIPIFERDLARIAHLFSTRERKILESLYGLNGEPQHTLDEICRCFGVTRARIKQVGRGLYLKSGIYHLKLADIPFPGVPGSIPGLATSMASRKPRPHIDRIPLESLVAAVYKRAIFLAVPLERKPEFEAPE